MRTRLILIALALLPAGALAQGDSTGQVSGVVYDSVARAPIRGAFVQMVIPANLRQVGSGETDAQGRFLIVGLAPGRYVIGFQHEALDSLALNAPLRAVDIRAGERATADLAVPSAATIKGAVCGKGEASDSTGLMIGMLRDARSRLPLDTGGAQASWYEIVFGQTGLTSTRRHAESFVGKEGWFALCGIPGGVDVIVHGWRGSDSTGILALSVPVLGIARHDLFVGGTANIRGSIQSEKSKPVVNAQVSVAGRDRGTRTDSGGAFRLGDVPAGSQTIEVRAIGYAPELRRLELVAGSDTALNLTVTSVKRVLDTIQVFAQRIYDRDRSGFLARKRAGLGRFLDEDDIRRRHPFDVFSLLFQTAFVRVTGMGSDRRVVFTGRGRECTPSLFINGMRMTEMLGDLDLLVRPDEIRGMEVYTSSTSTPPQFGSFNDCGAIVLWTGAPRRPPK